MYVVQKFHYSKHREHYKGFLGYVEKKKITNEQNFKHSLGKGICREIFFGKSNTGNRFWEKRPV